MIALPSIVYGDIGPKPSIEIIVKKSTKSGILSRFISGL